MQDFEASFSFDDGLEWLLSIAQTTTTDERVENEEICKSYWITLKASLLYFQLKVWIGVSLRWKRNELSEAAYETTLENEIEHVRDSINGWIYRLTLHTLYSTKLTRSSTMKTRREIGADKKSRFLRFSRKLILDKKRAKQGASAHWQRAARWMNWKLRKQVKIDSIQEASNWSRFISSLFCRCSAVFHRHSVLSCSIAVSVSLIPQFSHNDDVISGSNVLRSMIASTTTFDAKKFPPTRDCEEKKEDAVMKIKSVSCQRWLSVRCTINYLSQTLLWNNQKKRRVGK